MSLKRRHNQDKSYVETGAVEHVVYGGSSPESKCMVTHLRKAVKMLVASARSVKVEAAIWQSMTPCVGVSMHLPTKSSYMASNEAFVSKEWRAPMALQIGCGVGVIRQNRGAAETETTAGKASKPNGI